VRRHLARLVRSWLRRIAEVVAYPAAMTAKCELSKPPVGWPRSRRRRLIGIERRTRGAESEQEIAPVPELASADEIRCLSEAASGVGTARLLRAVGAR
jgi:hypothetical protein